MKVSIIVPTYNGGSTLKKCVTSLSAQTYTDIEIIIVNDGSTDNTATLATSLAHGDDRIQVITQENGGVSAARNTGIKAATGDILMFVDGDDYVDPDYCRLAVENMTTYESDICIMGYLREEGASIEKHLLAHPVGLMAKDEVMVKTSDLDMGNFVGCKAFRAYLFEHVQFLEGKNYEDIRIFYQLVELAAKISYCPVTTYHYVQHPNSIVTTLSKRNIRDSLEAATVQYEYFARNYPQAAQAAHEYLLVVAVRYCLYMEHDDLYNQAQRYLRELPIPAGLKKKYRWPMILFKRLPFTWGLVRWAAQRLQPAK